MTWLNEKCVENLLAVIPERSGNWKLEAACQHADASHRGAVTWRCGERAGARVIAGPIEESLPSFTGEQRSTISQKPVATIGPSGEPSRNWMAPSMKPPARPMPSWSGWLGDLLGAYERPGDSLGGARPI
jgi:hypothetical protein